MPAAEAGWIEEPVMVTALSGIWGAGHSPALKTSFVELEGGASIYRAGTEHQHVVEMERNLERLTGSPVAVGFAPQLAPMSRGILLTANARLTRPVTPEEMRAAYLTRTLGERAPPGAAQNNPMTPRYVHHHLLRPGVALRLDITRLRPVSARAARGVRADDRPLCPFRPFMGG
jgi:hypothetical protein